MGYNFQKYSHGEADYYGEKYDYDSLMHYGNYAFSSNGYPTIAAKSNARKTLGQRNGFSAIDIRQLNKLYSCGGGKLVSDIILLNSSPNSDNCSENKASG